MGWEIDEVTKDFIRQSGWYDPEPSKEERANKVVIEISKKILSNAEDLDDCIFSGKELHDMATILETARDRVSRGIIGYDDIISDLREHTINKVLK